MCSSSSPVRRLVSVAVLLFLIPGCTETTPPEKPSVRIEGPPGLHLGFAIAYYDVEGRITRYNARGREIEIPESGVFVESLNTGHTGVLTEVNVPTSDPVTLILLDGDQELVRKSTKKAGQVAMAKAGPFRTDADRKTFAPDIRLSKSQRTDVEKFFQAISNDEVEKAIAVLHKKPLIDRHVLAAFVAEVQAKLGKLEDLQLDRWYQADYGDHEGISGAIRYKNGAANVRLVLHEGQIADMIFRSEQIPKQWLRKPVGSDRYRKQGVAIWKHIVTGRSTDAHAEFSALVHDKITPEKVDSLVKKVAGALEGLELRSIEVDREHFGERRETGVVPLTIYYRLGFADGGYRIVSVGFEFMNREGIRGRYAGHLVNVQYKVNAAFPSRDRTRWDTFVDALTSGDPEELRRLSDPKLVHMVDRAVVQGVMDAIAEDFGEPQRTTRFDGEDRYIDSAASTCFDGAVEFTKGTLEITLDYRSNHLREIRYALLDNDWHTHIPTAEFRERGKQFVRALCANDKANLSKLSSQSLQSAMANGVHLAELAKQIDKLRDQLGELKEVRWSSEQFAKTLSGLLIGFDLHFEKGDATCDVVLNFNVLRGDIDEFHLDSPTAALAISSEDYKPSLPEFEIRRAWNAIGANDPGRFKRMLHPDASPHVDEDQLAKIFQQIHSRLGKLQAIDWSKQPETVSGQWTLPVTFQRGEAECRFCYGGGRLIGFACKSKPLWIDTLGAVRDTESAQAAALSYWRTLLKGDSKAAYNMLPKGFQEELAFEAFDAMVQRKLPELQGGLASVTVDAVRFDDDAERIEPVMLVVDCLVRTNQETFQAARTKIAVTRNGDPKINSFREDFQAAYPVYDFAMQEQFARAMVSGEVDKVLHLIHPNHRRQIETPVLAGYLASIRESYGDLVGLRPDQLAAKRLYRERRRSTETDALAEFAKGKARLKLLHQHGYLVNFRWQSALQETSWVHRIKDTAVHSKQGKDFLMHWLSGDNAAAHASASAAFRRDISVDDLAADSRLGLKKMGKPEKIVFSSLERSKEANWIKFHYKIEYKSVETNGWVKFEFNAFSGEIVGCNFEIVDEP